MVQPVKDGPDLLIELVDVLVRTVGAKLDGPDEQRRGRKRNMGEAGARSPEGRRAPMAMVMVCWRFPEGIAISRY